MTWQGPVDSAQKTLNAIYEAVQASGGGDLVISLNPGEAVNVCLQYGVATADVNGDVIIATSPDGVLFESDSQAQRIILRKDNAEGDDPVVRNEVVAGVHSFKIRARNRTYTDGAGTPSDGTLDVRINEDGVNIP